MDTFTPTSFNSEQSFELSYVPRDSRLVRVDIVKDFIQRLINITPSTRPFEFSFSPNINTIKVFKKSGSGYALLERDRDYFVAIDDLTQLISIIWVLDGGNTTITTNDQIFIDYKFEKLTTLNLTRIASSPRNTQFDFYYTVNNETGVPSVHCYIPEVNKLFSKENVNLYEDPPIYSDVKSEIKVKVYYELNAEDFVEFVEESEDTYTTPTSLENYYEQTLNRYLTKDGLTIQQVLDNLLLNNGDEDNNDAK